MHTCLDLKKYYTTHMSTRTRKEHKQYISHRRTFSNRSACVFCEIVKGHPEYVSETKSFKIIKNAFSYSSWDDQDVLDHLMIVPKNHIDTLSHLSTTESKEFVELISHYESSGYNVWARAAQTVRKSVVHQHTHLIKPGRRVRKFLFYIARPYIRITR
jgi:diadenosine tetraphosphate (Ap4A) HIT family hydrolase